MEQMESAAPLQLAAAVFEGLPYKSLLPSSCQAKKEAFSSPQQKRKMKRVATSTSEKYRWEI